MTHELPELPYDYNALEPYIDEQTMRVHHDKHHQGYTNKFNKAIEGTDLENKDPEEVLRNLDELPEEIKIAVKNNGGGYVNHAQFWTAMSPNGGGEPAGALGEAIKEKFGSFEAFKEEFSKAAAGRFGSGWAWLSVDENGELVAENTSNQDSPLSEGRTPILGLDVWEHAYYLKYQNQRGTYIDQWWNVVNWEEIQKRYKATQ